MSLADSLIAIFIFTLIIGMLIGVYLSYNNIFKIQVANNELSSSSTIAHNKISKNIRAATSVVETHTINSTEYTTDSDTMILEIPSIDADQNIIADSYDYLAFFKDGTILKSDLEPAAGSSRTSGTQIVSDLADNINFNYNNTDYLQINKVEIILVSAKTAGKSEQQIIMQSTVSLRNK